MSERIQRVLIGVQLDNGRRSLAQEDDLWGFHLTFQVGSKAQGEEEIVRAWVETESVGGVYVLQRTVQRRLLGNPNPTTSATKKLCEQYLVREVHLRLREFLFLWTQGLQVDKQVRPILEQNLLHLQRYTLAHHSDERPLAYAQVYLYDHIPTDDKGAVDEVLRYAESASTETDLRRVVLELPLDCTTFLIHMHVSDRIVGNAEYQVEQAIDQQTGKREQLLVVYEFGTCENMHLHFADLYTTDER